MSVRWIATFLMASTLGAACLAQSNQGVGERRGANGGADRGSLGTTVERQVRRDDTTTRHHTQVYGPVNGGGRRYDGSSNGLQGGQGQHSRSGHGRRRSHSGQEDDRLRIRP